MSQVTTIDARPDPAPRPVGRPRCTVTRQSIMSAAYDLLAEGGLRHFTIEGVAARSGVARTTIYRWWPSKGALAMESFLAATAADMAVAPSGSAIADLRTQLRSLAALLRGRPGRILCGIIAEGQTDPETIAAFTERYLAPRRREARAILQAGIDAGEFRADLDIVAAQSALYSPLHLRLLLRESLDDAWVDALVDTVLRGCLPPAFSPPDNASPHAAT